MAQAEEIRTETGPLDYDYTEKEVELCQENLQNHKACSPDKIKNEMLKYGGTRIVSFSGVLRVGIARGDPKMPRILDHFVVVRVRETPPHPKGAQIVGISELEPFIAYHYQAAGVVGAAPASLCDFCFPDLELLAKELRGEGAKAGSLAKEAEEKADKNSPLRDELEVPLEKKEKKEKSSVSPGPSFASRATQAASVASAATQELNAAFKSIIGGKEKEKGRGKESKEDLANEEEEAAVPLNLATPFQGEKFSFVLTDTDGKQIYAFCRRFFPISSSSFSSSSSSSAEPAQPPSAPSLLLEAFPTCLCVLSWQPMFGILPALLEYVHVKWVLNPGAAISLLEQIGKLPFPEPGSKLVLSLPYLPAKHKLVLPAHTQGAQGGHLPSLFATLSSDNVLLVFSALLCEKRILLSSAHLDKVTECLQAVRAMLYPFDWQHVFVPLLPASLLSYAGAPVPFLLGIRLQHLKKALEFPLREVVVVNLDKNQVFLAGETDEGQKPFNFWLPESLVGKFHKRIKSDFLTGKRSEQELKDAFFTFFVVLFAHCDWQNLAVGPWSAAKLDSFVRPLGGPPDVKKFLAIIRHSQFLMYFLETHVKIIQHQQAKDQQRLQQAPPQQPQPVAGAIMAGEEQPLHQQHFGGLVWPLEIATNFSLTGKALKEQEGRRAGALELGLLSRDTKKTALEATGNTPPTRPQEALLAEMAAASYVGQPPLLPVMVRVLLERLKDCKKKNWQHGVKALAVLFHLLCHGSERIVLAFSVKHNLELVEKLLEYGHSDATVCDKMREQVTKVHGALVNPFTLKSLRSYSPGLPLAPYRETALQGALPHSVGPRYNFFKTAPLGQGGITNMSFSEFREKSLITHEIPAIPNFQALHASLLDASSTKMHATPTLPPAPGNPRPHSPSASANGHVSEQISTNSSRVTSRPPAASGAGPTTQSSSSSSVTPSHSISSATSTSSFTQRPTGTAARTDGDAKASQPHNSASVREQSPVHTRSKTLDVLDDVFSSDLSFAKSPRMPAESNSPLDFFSSFANSPASSALCSASSSSSSSSVSSSVSTQLNTSLLDPFASLISLNLGSSAQPTSAAPKPKSHSSSAASKPSNQTVQKTAKSGPKKSEDLFSDLLDF
eukprot:g73885.t1